MSDDYRAIVVGNFAEGATLSGGDYQLPLTNAQTRDMGVYARTTNVLEASTKVVIDLTRAEQIAGLMLCKINASIDATYRIQSSDDSGFSSIKYDTGSTYLNFPGFVVEHTLLPYNHPDGWDGVLRRWLVSQFPRHLIHVIDDADILNAYARYWRILIKDTANTDGYLQFAYAVCGEGFRPAVNYNANGFGIQNLTDVSEALGGQETFWERAQRRTWRAGFDFVSNAEAFGAGLRLMVNVRDSRPVFVVPDWSDKLNLQHRSFLARFTETPLIEQLAGFSDMTKTSLDFKEWK